MTPDEFLNELALVMEPLGWKRLGFMLTHGGHVLRDALHVNVFRHTVQVRAAADDTSFAAPSPEVIPLVIRDILERCRISEVAAVAVSPELARYLT